MPKKCEHKHLVKNSILCISFLNTKYKNKIDFTYYNYIISKS